MIRVQLWKDAAMLSEVTTDDPNVAARRIDELITECHAKKYGTGRFAIEAEHFDEKRRVFLGHFFRNNRIHIAAEIPATTAHAGR